MTPEGEDKIRKAFADDDLNDVKAQNSWHIFKIMSEFVEGFEKMTRIGLILPFLFSFIHKLYTL